MLTDFSAGLRSTVYSGSLELDAMFRPLPPTSLSLSGSFTLRHVTMPSSAAGFTAPMASSADPWDIQSASLRLLGNLMP